jgi:F-type H+-transporting ATPase subunit epsilon
MPEQFQLTVLTPTRTFWEGSVESLIAPGSDGYLGVLAHHAPLITSLQPGKLTIRSADGTTRFYALSGGFLEVSENQAVILADALEAPETIDVKRAREAAERARQRLQDRSRWDTERAEAALQRALNRIKVGDEGGA